MPKILFTRSPSAAQGNDGSFLAGTVHDLSPRSAARWISRGVATDDADAIARAEGAAVTKVDWSAPEAADNWNASAAAVEIPDNWASAGWQELRALAARIAGTSPKNKEAAIEGITRELLARSRPAYFHTKLEGGDSKIYVMDPWPKYTAISDELLKPEQLGTGVAITDEGVVITTANGTATYRHVAEDAAAGVQIFSLGESTFEPIPAA